MYNIEYGCLIVFNVLSLDIVIYKYQKLNISSNFAKNATISFNLKHLSNKFRPSQGFTRTGLSFLSSIKIFTHLKSIVQHFYANS